MLCCILHTPYAVISKNEKLNKYKETSLIKIK